MKTDENQIDDESRKALKELGIDLSASEPKPLIEDCSYGIDCRGDEAFFIESYHINGWEIDKVTQAALAGQGPTFFRALDNGIQEHTHGWIEDGKIVQYG